MTEYGRGPSPEPWHPEDPLNGDQGWETYGGQQQQYPQQPQTQAPHYPQQPDPYGYEYGTGQQQPQPQGYPQQQPQHQQQQQPYGGGWDTGQQQQQQSHQPQQQYQNPGYGDPYGGQGHPDPYGNQAAGTYGGQQPDYYATPGAYPPPQPPSRREPVPQQQAQPEQPRSDWDAQLDDEPDHAFFGGPDTDSTPDRDTRGAGDDGDDEPPRGRGGREPGGRKPKKRRSGMACLIVATVFLGIGGGGAYYVYSFWQDRFGEAPDFAGVGSNPVEVKVPSGTSTAGIGRLLKEAGVVKSVDAFVSAAGKDPKGGALQAGVYNLNQEMSAANAVKAMVDPQSLNALIIPEGRRNAWIYEQIDDKLDQKAGTTKKIASEQAKNLGLPEWADDNPKIKDPLEGFLYPASYPIAKSDKPDDLLREMIKRANAEYTKADVAGKADELGLESPLQVITVASLAQAEGTSHDDFKKMARVMYNRLEPTNTETNGLLQFDSTYNYIKNQSELDITLEEIKTLDNPYNTYFYKGLPPGPIGNPGAEALTGALEPDKGDWFYFISLDGKTSKFTKTNAEHQKLVDEFNRLRKNG